MFLCFSGHTGYGGYGKWKRGSRQILLDESTMPHSFRTWMRFEDGSTHGEVTLNQTYGKDWYPAVNREYSAGC